MAANFIKETDVLQAMRMTRQGSSKEERPRKEYHQDKKIQTRMDSPQSAPGPKFWKRSEILNSYVNKKQSRFLILHMYENPFYSNEVEQSVILHKYPASIYTT